ncbi:hypothetical protein KI387_004978, partial [Taxus chinensis]
MTQSVDMVKDAPLAHGKGCRHKQRCAFGARKRMSTQMRMPLWCTEGDVDTDADAPLAHRRRCRHSECWQEADPEPDIKMAITFDWELGFTQ